MCKLDKDYVNNLIKDIESGLKEIKDIMKMSPREFINSRRSRFSLRYSIILISESISDLGLYVLRKCFKEEARSYREIFDKLLENGVISLDVASVLKGLVSLKNLVIHRYWSIDDLRIYRESSNGIEFVEKYVSEVLDYVSKDP